MIVPEKILYISIASILLGVIILITHLYETNKKFEKQTSKAINLYLDKKFITKLLSIYIDEEKSFTLNLIIDKILDYFCLEFIAIKLLGTDYIISFKTPSFNILYKERDIKLLLSHSDEIENEIGYKAIKNENRRQIILFKNKKICMIVVPETRHKLSLEEKETLCNEMLLIIGLAVFFNKKLTKNSFSHRKMIS